MLCGALPPSLFDRLGGVVVERPPRLPEGAYSFPGRVIPKTLKGDSNDFSSLALRAVGLELRMTRWFQDKWTSSSGKLPRKRRDITEKMLKAVKNPYTKKSCSLTLSHIQQICCSRFCIWIIYKLKYNNDI